MSNEYKLINGIKIAEKIKDEIVKENPNKLIQTEKQKSI